LLDDISKLIEELSRFTQLKHC